MAATYWKEPKLLSYCLLSYCKYVPDISIYLHALKLTVLPRELLHFNDASFWIFKVSSFFPCLGIWLFLHCWMLVFLLGAITRRSNCSFSLCGLLLDAFCATWPFWRSIWRRRYPGSTPFLRKGPYSFALWNSMTPTSTMNWKLRYVKTYLDLFGRKWLNSWVNYFGIF